MSKRDSLDNIPFYTDEEEEKETETVRLVPTICIFLVLLSRYGTVGRYRYQYWVDKVGNLGTLSTM